MATTTQKPQRSPEEIEDIMLKKVLLVTLTDPGDSPSQSSVPSSDSSKVVYLELTAAEILSEGKELRLNRELIERVIIDRISNEFPGVENLEPPFEYLAGCYRRADEEGRKIKGMKDKKLRAELESVVGIVMSLSVSYTRIHLGNPGLFGGGEGDKPGEKKVSPLLPLLYAEVGETVTEYGGRGNELDVTAVKVPFVFVNDVLKGDDFDTLDSVFKCLYDNLRERVVRESLLGEFMKPLCILLYLINDCPLGAKSLVTHKWWLPPGAYSNGRAMEVASILGPFFHVSALPDTALFRSQPDVGQQCFSEVSTRRHSDMVSSFATIQTVSHQLYDRLHEVVLSLLKDTETRENALNFLAAVINSNSARSHLQVDPLTCASSGMFVNLCAVLLKLCEPFIRGELDRRVKIDPLYVFIGQRLELRELTALHASSEEVSAYISELTKGVSDGSINLAARKSRSKPLVAYTSADCSVQIAKSSTDSNDNFKFPFISECFFMTARVLNLGLLKAFSDYKHLAQDISRCEDTLATLKGMQEQAPSRQLEMEIARLEKDMESYSQEKLCYEAQILRDPLLLEQSVAFYHLMVVWLADLVGGFRMPLPSPCPMKFACMPEHFVEDALELLIFAARTSRPIGAGDILEDFMNFIIMFMASPEYIRNPYLRAKMVEVLNCWMPNRSPSTATTTLFEGHELALEHLVRNLLKLYVDIEFTGSHTQFYDKFNIRHNIAELLEYLWQVPSHRNVWKRIAKEEEKGVYLNFLNFLINDSIYLLDESLNKILELKALEAEMSNTAEWEQRPVQERQERTRLFHSQENIIKIDMKLANEDVSLLAFTSEQITSPFLLPEMVERVASMLNYFLLQLVGPQRKSLSLKDPEKYEFRPKHLLKQIVIIYANLAKGDQENVFPSAISRDGRSYNDQLFGAAADVLRKIGEDGRLIEEFVELGVKARAAAAEAMDVENALGDIPDEFLDPIQYTLMKDPVILPSSRVTVDRPVILRHLLSDMTDPFNRSQLSPEMLIPDTELKARIEEFIKKSASKKCDEDLTLQSSKGTLQAPKSDVPMIDGEF